MSCGSRFQWTENAFFVCYAILSIFQTQYRRWRNRIVGAAIFVTQQQMQAMFTAMA